MTRLLDEALNAGAICRQMTALPSPHLIFDEAAETEIIIHAVRHAARDPAGMPGTSYAESPIPYSFELIVARSQNPSAATVQFPTEPV